MNLKLKEVIAIIVLFTVLPIFSDYLPNSKNVLILHSYSPSMTWVEEMNLGIEETIDNEYSLEIQTSIEFLDAKRFNSDLYFLHTAQALKFKYENQQFDAIISCDDHALDFLIKYRDICFPEIPVFFCGVNNFYSSTYTSFPDIKGIFEKNPIDQNFKLIKQLLPETETIYAVVDPNTKTNKIYRQRITEFLMEYNPEIKIQMSENHTFSDLEEHLATLDENTTVLYFSYLVDKNAEYIQHIPIARRLLRRCNRPVFTVNKIYLSQNVIGGIVTDPRAHAASAAIMMIDYLRGISLSDIKEIDYLSEKLFPLIFNRTSLENYQISTKNLPETAQIYDIDKYIKQSTNRKVVYFSLIILITGLVLVFLIVVIVAERKNSRELKSKNGFLQAITEIEPAILFQMDKSGRYLFISSQVTRLFGLETSQVIGQTSREAGFCEAHCLADEKVISMQFSESEKHEVEYWVENPFSEKNHYCKVQHFPIFINGVLEKYQGIVLDITGIKEDYDDVRYKYKIYRQICNDNSMGIAVIKPEFDEGTSTRDYRVTDINPAFTKVLNIPERDGERKYLSEFSQSIMKEVTEFLNNDTDQIMPVYISDCDKWLSISISILDNDEMSLNIFDFSSLKLKLDEMTDNYAKISRENDKLLLDFSTINDQLSSNQQLLINQSEFAFIGKMLTKVTSQWLHSLTRLKHFVQDDETSLKSDYKFNQINELVSDTIDSLMVFEFLFDQYEGPSEFDLAELIENTLIFFSSTLQSVQINVKHQLQGGCCCQGMSNEYALVILNILNNSQDAFITNEIDQPQISLNLTSANDICTLRIKDNAGGIPNDYHQKIFTPFFTTKLEHSDSGLGLFICKNIIENKFQGKISINQSDNGSEFIIETKICMM
jgi:PAS domain S-box-containing protein